MALGGYRLAFLLPMEAAADGVDWMLLTMCAPLVMLRNSIVPHSVIAQMQFAASDSRSKEIVAEDVQAREEVGVESRRVRKDKKSAELKAKCSAGAFQTRTEGEDWTTSDVNLDAFRRLNKFRVDDLRRPLISGDATLLVKPSKGDASAVYIRAAPGFDLSAAVAGLSAQGAAPVPAEHDAAAPAEHDAAAPAEDDGAEAAAENDDAPSDNDNTVLAIIGRDEEDSTWFLVKWMTGEETYEPKENLTNCWELVEEYLASVEPELSAYEKKIQEKKAENQRKIAEIGALHSAEIDALQNAAAADALQNASPPTPPEPTLPPTPPSPSNNFRDLPRTASDLTMIVDDDEDDGCWIASCGTTPAGTPDASTEEMSPTESNITEVAPRSTKRQGVSPAQGTPSPSACEPPAKVRSSPRFQMLPGAKPMPTLKVGDNVKAIFQYKEGGTSFCKGQVTAIDGDKQHFTILYDDNDIEEHVSRAVITLLKSKLLDKSPEV